MKVDMAQNLSLVRFVFRKDEDDIYKAFTKRCNASDPSVLCKRNQKGEHEVYIKRPGFGIALQFLEIIGSPDQKAQALINKLYCQILWVQEQDALDTDVSNILANMRSDNDTLH